jgi:oxygen-independent coproporphyrinogen-3 oxidase
MTGWGNLDLHPLNSDFLALYVHVPYCRRRCDYCAFHSTVLPKGYTAEVHHPETYVDSTLRALRSSLARVPDAVVSTVYVGGGTPSCLGPHLLSRLLAGISVELADRQAVVEWTVEANPEDLSREFLDRLADVGVTRLSVGVQSFEPELRRTLGRHGDARTPSKALDRAKSAWTGSLSADLIAGIPGQTARAAVRDVEQLLHFEPDHVSAYALTVEAGTPLARRYGGRGGQAELLSGGAATEAWEAAGDRLEAAGLERYEVSNYARPGARCRHNELFWRGRPYLGVGRGAVSTLWAGKAHAGRGAGTVALRWTEGAAGEPRELERLGYRELLQEYLMTRLRTEEGLDMGALGAIFGLRAAECVWTVSRKLEREGLADLRPASHRRGTAAWRGPATKGGNRPSAPASSAESVVTVTRRGRRFLDELLRQLFGSLGQLDSHLGKW